VVHRAVVVAVVPVMAMRLRAVVWVAVVVMLVMVVTVTVVLFVRAVRVGGRLVCGGLAHGRHDISAAQGTKGRSRVT
jgi:hypothetical protein